MQITMCLQMAINGGCVDQYVLKPWNPPELSWLMRTFIKRYKREPQGGPELPLSASIMAMQAGTAGMLELGIPELYRAYLASLEVFSGICRHLFPGGRASRGIDTSGSHVGQLVFLCGSLRSVW